MPCLAPAQAKKPVKAIVPKSTTLFLFCTLFAVGCSNGAPGSFEPAEINGFHVYEVRSYQGPKPDWVDAPGAAHCLYKLIARLNGDNPHSEIYSHGTYQGRRGCYDSNFTPSSVGKFNSETGILTSGGIEISIIAYNPEQKISLVWLMYNDGECRLCDNEIFAFQETTKSEPDVSIGLNDEYQFETHEHPVIRRVATINVIGDDIRQYAFSNDLQPFDVMKRSSHGGRRQIPERKLLTAAPTTSAPTTSAPTTRPLPPN